MAYLLMFLFGITSTTVMFPPTEVALLVLTNLHEASEFTVPWIHVTISAQRYGARFPWLLPVVAAVSTNIGNSMWYFIGSGLLNIRAPFINKYLDKIRAIDINKVGRTKEAVLWSACLISAPPVTAVAFASGAVNYGFVRFHAVTIVPKIIRYYLVMIFGEVFINLGKVIFQWAVGLFV